MTPRTLALLMIASVLPACALDPDRTVKLDARAADGPAARLPVNHGCKAGAECATGLCWYGVCSFKNPRPEGQPCFGKGECRSANCLGGRCVPGARRDGRTCRFDEECQSQRCEAGRCKPKAVKPDSMVCTLDTFCKVVKPGYACCCHDESNWHPCCPPKCSAIVVRACEKATGKCLDFCSSCLPPGWTPARK